MQRKGIEKAKQEGKYKGRKHALNHEKAETLRSEYLKGKSISALSKDFKIGRASVYRYLEGVLKKEIKTSDKYRKQGKLFDG